MPLIYFGHFYVPTDNEAIGLRVLLVRSRIHIRRNIDRIGIPYENFTSATLKGSFFSPASMRQ
jgi:hypothetical protein